MTRYLPLLERLDAWHASARVAHPDLIPCRAGCAACCRGPFDIGVADAALVIDAVRALPGPVRREVAARAAEQIASAGRLAPDWESPYDVRSLGEAGFDRVSDALADLPCPCLDPDGQCLIYSDRPMVCRMIGIGMVTESGFTIENACPIQDDYPDYARLPPRPFPLEALEPEEDRANAAAALRLFGDPGQAGFETTVAGAIAGLGLL